MNRREIVQLLDGTHPTRGNGVAIAHQILIMAAALAIAVSTMKDLPAPLVRALAIFDLFILAMFTTEYLARIICTDRPLRYIFSFWGVIDLMACLPILLIFSPQWAALRAMRLLRLIWVMKLLHSNRALIRLEQALQRSRGELLVFAILALIILYIAGVGIYIFENEAQPDKFSSVPVSLWWAVVSFTTVGYGDMFPITAGGRIFTSLVLFVGLGVIAVPTAIITTALIQSDLATEIEEDMREDLRKSQHLDRMSSRRKKTVRKP